MSVKKRLLFVSPRFLFPIDTGGKIRTTQILRRLKGGHFRVELCSPAGSGEVRRYAREVEELCDTYAAWPALHRGPLFKFTRMRHLLSQLPIPIRDDRVPAGLRLVSEKLREGPDVVVFDFLHSAVLAPERLDVPSICFTHNVEAEIFKRHATVAENPVFRAIWRDQYKKMRRFEQRALARFDSVVAVSERDAAFFRAEYGLRRVETIPTGVDLDYFAFQEPGDTEKVVFTGSMDWMANIDGIEWLMQDIWPRLVAARPRASMVVIGKDPPAKLVQSAPPGFAFTGFVDDVRTHMAGASAYVIPLRVGGGTRIKAFEAMASGIPVVSTAIGVEGLPVEPEAHYLRADDAESFAAALVRLLTDSELRHRLARAAREHVEANFSNDRVATVFEEICRGVL